MYEIDYGAEQNLTLGSSAESMDLIIDMDQGELDIRFSDLDGAALEMNITMEGEATTSDPARILQWALIHDQDGSDVTVEFDLRINQTVLTSGLMVRCLFVIDPSYRIGLDVKDQVGDIEVNGTTNLKLKDVSIESDAGAIHVDLMEGTNLSSNIHIKRGVGRGPPLLGGLSCSSLALTRSTSPRRPGRSSYSVSGGRSDVRVDVPIPAAPFFGAHVVNAIPLADVFAFVNEVALFRTQWQFHRGKGQRDRFDELIRTHVRPIYERWKTRCALEAILAPRVVYGYFPCHSDGDDVIVYEEDGRTPRLRFSFPRQSGGRRLCLADFFAAKDSGRMDVFGCMLVTVGRHASEVTRQLFEEHNYTDYLYLHGLSVESAEALAELWHKRIREQLGIAGDDSSDLTRLLRQEYRGSRYRFGYPACPNLGPGRRPCPTRPHGYG